MEKEGKGITFSKKCFKKAVDERVVKIEQKTVPAIAFLAPSSAKKQEVVRAARGRGDGADGRHHRGREGKQ